MMRLQELIHKFEEGEGVRWIKLGAGLLGLLGLLVIYDLREYRNFASPESMDNAQLARNIAEGKGFSTDVVRPLSCRIIRERRTDGDMGLRGPHPDLFNAPLYPLVTAALMKLLPFNYEIAEGSAFLRYQPEVLLALFNQALFLAAAWMLFRLARRLFDAEVAWVTCLLFLGAEIFWRFSVSGLPVMLLLAIFLAVSMVLARFEDELRQPIPAESKLLGLAALVGALLSAGMLTRYSFGWLLAPSLALIAWIAGPRRWRLMAILALVFGGVAAPWWARNIALSGSPFGGAWYGFLEGTEAFQSDRLWRSLNPNFGLVDPESVLRKLAENSETILVSELPRLGGSWVAAFFLAGLLVPYLNPGLNRLRMFVLMAIALLIPVEAVGRSPVTAATPDGMEFSLLVIVAPLVFMFGAGFFFLLLDQLNLPSIQVRWVGIAGFVVVGCLGLGLKLLPPRSLPVVYPPYYPPWIRMVSNWMKPSELLMSDIPWAVAWYGRRTCMWTVLDADKEFYTVNDYQKPVMGLYLTHVTTDVKFYSRMVRPNEKGWEWFMLQSLVKTNIPPGFPLRVGVPGFLQEGQLFLTDRERWLDSKK